MPVYHSLWLVLITLFLSSCANLDTREGRLQNDVNYLLEEKLLDGEVAAWVDQSEPNTERNLAVFLTCSEDDTLCRYYFSYLIENGKKTPRVYGKSCRKYTRSWDPVNWDPRQNVAMDKEIRGRYEELRGMNRNAQPYHYRSKYSLPVVLARQVTKAESQYHLPLREMIDKTSERHGINPVLIHSVVKTESNYNPKARSHVGAIGLMQLMPGTAGDLKVNPRDPAQNLEGGTRYLRQQLKRPGINGDISLALASYNAGYGNVRKYGYKVPPYKETRNYVKKIMALYTSR